MPLERTALLLRRLPFPFWHFACCGLGLDALRPQWVAAAFLHPFGRRALRLAGFAGSFGLR